MKLLDRIRARRRLRAYAPLSAEAREGDRVHVVGTVRILEDSLVAPLTGLTCVGYRARAQGGTEVGGKILGTGWLETMELVPFVIERAGATSIVVEGNHALFGIAGQSSRKRTRDREVSFLARHAIRPGRSGLDEVVLEVGRRVTVGGTLVLVPRAAPPMTERGFREPPTPEQRLAGSRDLPLVILTH